MTSCAWPRAARVLPVAALLLALTSLRGAAEDASPLAQFHFTSHDLYRDSPVVRFTYDSRVNEPLAVSVLGVFIAGAHDETLTRAVEAHVNAASGLSGVEVTAKGALFTEPGDYELRVRLSAGGAHQVETLRLRVHAPVLRATTLYLSQSWGSDELFPRQFAVEEIGRRGALTALSIEQAPARSPDGEPIRARVIATPAKTDLERGGRVKVDLELEDTFPAGTTRGNLEVRGDQLQAPVLVPFEVRRRRPPCLIPVVFFLSSILGWFLRVYLQQRERTAEAEAQALAVLEALRAELQRAPTAAHRGQLSEARKRLATALQEGAPDAIVTEAMKGQETLERARVEFNKARDDLAQRLITDRQALEQLTSTPPSVPLAELKSRVEQGLAAVSEGDLALALSLEADTRRLVRELETSASAWAVSLRASVEELRALSAPAPRALRPLLEEDLKQIEQRSAALQEAIRTHPNELEEILPALEEMQRARDTLSGHVRDVLDHEAARINRELAPAAQLDWTSPFAPAGPGTAAEPLVRAHEALSGFASAVAARLRAMGRDPTKDVSYLNGDFAGAFRGVSGAADGLEALEASGAGNPAFVASTLQPATRKLVPRPLLIRDRSRPLVEISRVAALSRLAVLRSLRGVLVAALSSAVAYYLYRDRWMGTVDDLFTLATLGFSSDFTIESLLDFARSKPASSPPAAQPQ